MFTCRLLLLIAAIVLAWSPGAACADGPRRTLSLNGEWEIGEGGMGSPPAAFGSRVPVPGLVDMAAPAFADVGVKSPRREAYWYRRTFRVEGPIPAVAILKIHKAMFGYSLWEFRIYR